MADGDITAGIRAAAIGQNTKSPLDTVQQAATIGNTLTYNKLLNQNILNAQQEIENKRQELQNMQLANQKSQFDLANASLNRVNANVGSLLAMDDLTGSKGHDAIMQIADKELENHPGSEHAKRAHDTFVSTVPPATQEDGSPTPQAVYRQFLFQHLMATADARDQLEASRHPMIDIGGQMVAGPSIAEGVIKGAAGIAPIQRTLTPGEKAKPIAKTDDRLTVPDPQDPSKQIPNENFGKPTEVLTGDVVAALGHPEWLGPGAVGGTAAPGAAAPGGPPGAAGATGPAPAGAIPALKTGPSEGQKKQAEVSTALYNTDKLAATNYKQSLYPTEQVYQLANTKGVDLGEGTESANKFYQFLNSQAPDWVRQHGLTPRNVMDVANRELIEKYMVQSMFATSPYATSSNAMMDAASQGNPTGNKSNETVSHVAAAMIGMRRLQQLGFQAFQQYAKDHNIDPQDISHAYATFIGDWQKNIDPRALMFDMTRNSDLQKLNLSTVKPKYGMSEEDKFRYTQKLAKDNDLYDQTPPPETR